MSAVLVTERLDAGYNGHPVVTELDIEVDAGQVVALLGANGAGKTTTILTAVGAIPPVKGQVLVHGRPTRASLAQRARGGLSYVSEERSVFASLTAAENLRVGGCSVAAALAVFPELEPHLGQRAGLLSGGQQQMLTLARAIGRQPSLLVVDELSLGLAPMLVRRLLDAVRRAADESGAAVLVVEQHVRQALRIADHAYVLRRGRVVLQGSSAEIRARQDDLHASYLAHGRIDDTTPDPTDRKEPVPWLESP